MPRHHFVAGVKRHLNGCRQQHLDSRDHLSSAIFGAAFGPPPKGGFPAPSPILDQGGEGSCTANAKAGACRLLRLSLGMPDLAEARQFGYYVTRVLVEGVDPSEDSGATIRDTYKAASQYGALDEAQYPYTPDNFSRVPPPEVFEAAKAHPVVKYAACPTLQDIKIALSLHYPVQFGFSVPASMQTEAVALSGMVTRPKPGEATLGGHSVYAYAYDDTLQVPGDDPGVLLCANSWGESWGLDGTFWLPYSFWSLSLAWDAWAPRMES